MAHVLVVDDMASERVLVQRILEKKGHKVSTAASGDEALTMVEKDLPDVVVLDVVMPGKSGFDVCRALKKEKKLTSVSVILLTSRKQQSDRFWGMRQGACEYLTKPFEAMQLLAAVQKYAPRAES